MKLLVTGGAGYIGGVVTSQLLEAGHEAVVFDNLSTGSESVLPQGARLVQGDLLDAEALRSVLAAGFEGVLHFAALSMVGRAAGALLPHQLLRDAQPPRCYARGRRKEARLLLHGRRLRRARGGPGGGGLPDPSDQPLRGLQARR